MNRKTAEKGSLHAIITIVLFVALMATLGIVFYQNFVAEKPSVTQEEKPEPTPSSQTTTHIAFGSSLYALDHMKDWKVAKEEVLDSTMGGTVTKVASPDGSVQAVFGISEKAPDTICDSTDGLKISSYSVSPPVTEGLASVPLYLVEALYDAEGGGYHYAIGLVPDSGDTHASVGETHCNISHVGIVSSALMKNNVLEKPTLTARIHFPELPEAPEAASKDMQSIKKLMETQEYEAAVKILESARKE